MPEKDSLQLENKSGKKNPARQKFLSIAVAMNLTVKETQHLLYFCGSRKNLCKKFVGQRHFACALKKFRSCDEFNRKRNSTPFVFCGSRKLYIKDSRDNVILLAP
ncbi:MAG: hypothetical protein IJT73_00815 [Selenomonadaceae bacterium]|nr:hypothetical protein [Selenomonadaceae bacterium]